MADLSSIDVTTLCFKESYIISEKLIITSKYIFFEGKLKQSEPHILPYTNDADEDS